MLKLLRLIRKNFLFLGTAFLLFFIPLYPKFPLMGVSGTYVHIRLEDIFVSLIVLGFGVDLILRKDYSIFKDSLTKTIILFFAIGFLSILSALFITKNISFHLALFHFLRRVEYISLFFVSYFSFKDKNKIKTYIALVFIATLGVVIYGMGQKFLNWPVISTMNDEFSRGLVLRLTWWARINSTFAGHYDLAAFMVMIIPLVIVSFMMAKNWLVKFAVFIVGLLAYYILLLTASRISFAAYIISMVFILFLMKKKLIIFPLVLLSFLGMFFAGDLGQRYAATFKVNLAFLSGLVAVKPSTIAIAPTLTPIPTVALIVTPVPGVTEIVPKPIPTSTPTPTPEPVATGSGEPVETTVLAVGRSTDIRLKVEWPRAIRAFLKNPLLGTGYSSITLATDNDYLRSLGETGILGSLAFLAVFLEIGRRILSFLKSKNVERGEKLIIIGVVGSSIGFFLNAAFIDVFEASKIAFFFWILIGIALRIIDLNKLTSNS